MPQAQTRTPARPRAVAGLGVLTLTLALAGCGGSGGSSTGATARSASTASTSASSTATPSTSTSTTTASTASTSSTTSTPAPSRAGVVTGSAGGVTATLHAGTHHPRVEAPWPIRFTVLRGGAPVKASVSYEYLFAGQVVARRSHYTFTGHFADVFRWPASAVGYPLTFRAVIVAGGARMDLDYPVQVVR